MIPEISTFLLVIFSALTFGGVTAFSVATIQVVTALTVAGWLLVRIKSGRLHLYRTPLDRPAVGFLSLATLSLTWSIYPYTTQIQLYRLFTYAAVFYLLTHSLRHRQRLLRFCRWIALWGAAYALVGLLRPEAVLEGLPYLASLSEQDVEKGLRLTFVNHSNFAGYLEMICCLTLGLALGERGTRRILLLFFAAVIALAICTSLSRGGMLGLAAGYGFLGLSTLFDRRDRNAAFWLFGLGVTIAIGLVTLLPSSPTLERLESLKRPLEAGKIRLAMWRESLDVIAERPWLGSGLGTYSYASPPHQSEQTARWTVDHPHNEYLERTAELGVVGSILATWWLMLLFAVGLHRLRRRQDSAVRRLGIGALAGCLALLIHDVVDFQLAVPSSALLFAICTAVVILCGCRECDRGQSVDLSSSRLLRTFAGILVLGVTANALVASFRIYAGDFQAGKAKQMIQEEQHDLAAAALERAIAVEPNNARHRGRKGESLRRQAIGTKDEQKRSRLLTEALVSFETAIEKCPPYAYYRSQRARLLLELGEVGQAQQSFERATSLAPKQAYHHHYLARFHLKHGDPDKAYAEFRRAIELEPRYFATTLRYLWQHEPDDDLLRRAVPEAASSRLDFARFLLNQGHQEGAIQELGRASLEPTEGSATESVRALISLGELATARKLHASYRRLLPESVGLQGLGAEILMAEGRDQEAKVEFESLIRDGRVPTTHLRLLLETYRRLEDLDGALARIREVLRRKPERAEIYLELAAFLKSVDRPLEASDVLLEGIERFDKDSRLFYARAHLMRSLGRHAEALEMFKRAVALAPRHQGYRHDLGKMYQQLGLYREAAVYWKTPNLDSADPSRETQALRELEQELLLQE